MRTCFILMPFSKANSLNQEDLDFIYNDVLKKAVEEYKVDGIQFFDIVERYNGKVGSIIDGIVKQLKESDLVIADLTGNNPNVMYELGVRHALKRGTIIVSQDVEKLPSDLRDFMTVGYKYSRKTTLQSSHYKSFKDNLHSTIHELNSTNKYDSPVLSYLTHRQIFRDEDAIENLKETAIIIDRITDECVDIAELVNLNALKDMPENNYSTCFEIFNLKLNNLGTAISDLNLPNKSPILYEKLLNTKTLLSEINKHSSLTDMFSGINALDEVPNGALGPKNFLELINKPFICPFTLGSSTEINVIFIKDIFIENGVLDKHLISYLIKFVEQRARELGVKAKELADLLKR
jgi:nucleoside 2-deoxyribosyltransferase